MTVMFSDGLVSLPTFYLESAFRNPLEDENSGASTAVSVPCNTGLSGMRRMHLGSAPEPLTLPPDPLCSVSLPTHWHSLHDLCAEGAGIMHLEMVIYAGREPLLWTRVLLTFPAALWASRPPLSAFCSVYFPHLVSTLHLQVILEFVDRVPKIRACLTKAVTDKHANNSGI